jgi:hypothetical protein
MKNYVDTFDAFDRLHHNRAMYDVTKQLTIRPNADTMYSFGIFDLIEDVVLNMPKTDRYQSAMVVSQDHSLFALYEGVHKLTQESIGTRYIFIVIRTFVDPGDKADLKEVHAAQDVIQLKQAEKGSFEVPAWDEVSLKAKRQDGAELSKLLPGTKGMFGDVKKLNPVISFLGAACCWGGLPEEDAYYGLDEVEKMMVKPSTQ